MSGRRRLVLVAAWSLVLAAVTAALLAGRGRLDKVHVALALLLVVLFGAAGGGRAVGLWLAGFSFLVFNWFFVPPYGTFAVRDPLDWLVLAAFLLTGIVAAQLLARAQERTRIAEALAMERVRLLAEAEHAEALREADRLKDALLAAVSHDLRTPLTTIKALAHDLGGLGDERAEIIEQEADRLERLVADLLDLSRLRAGALALQVELNAIDDLLGALLQRAEPTLHARLDVALAPGEALMVGRFDLVHSLRILSNLVENAAKYAPADSPIEVRAERRANTIAITVADRGPGIASGDVARVFEPFHRGTGLRAGTRGAGLGLSIARGLAEAQGGTLEYAPRPGGGSIFTLTLPSADLPASGAAAPAATS